MRSGRCGSGRDFWRCSRPGRRRAIESSRCVCRTDRCCARRRFRPPRRQPVRPARLQRRGVSRVVPGAGRPEPEPLRPRPRARLRGAHPRRPGPPGRTSSNPDRSLVLLKATGQVPHEGGQRFSVGSWEYRVIRAWIAEGARRDPSRAAVERIEIRPARLEPRTAGRLGPALGRRPVRRWRRSRRHPVLRPPRPRRRRRRGRPGRRGPRSPAGRHGRRGLVQRPARLGAGVGAHRTSRVPSPTSRTAT